MLMIDAYATLIAAIAMLPLLLPLWLRFSRRHFAFADAFH